MALPPPLVAELRAHRAAQLRLRLERANVWDHTRDLVFCTDWGALIDPHADYRDWKQILRDAGVREVRLHDVGAALWGAASADPTSRGFCPS